jgi:hypothetical protein
MANRFELLVERLGETVGLSPEINDHLRAALVYAGYEGTAAAASPKGEGKAAKTGYQLFFTSYNAEITPQFPDWKDRQPQIKAAWQAMTKEEKAVWATKAKGLAPEAGVARSKSPKSPKSKKGHISGWNLYMGEHSKKGAEKKPLKEISAMWHALTDEERAVWNAKAKGVSNLEAPVAPANTPEAEMESEEEADAAPVVAAVAAVAPAEAPVAEKPKAKGKGKSKTAAQ